MTTFLTSVCVALIGGPLMWGLHRLDRRNSAQHAGNQEVLTRIEGKVDMVIERQLEHLTNHPPATVHDQEEEAA